MITSGLNCLSAGRTLLPSLLNSNGKDDFCSRIDSKFLSKGSSSTTYTLIPVVVTEASIGLISMTVAEDIWESFENSTIIFCTTDSGSSFGVM